MSDYRAIAAVSSTLRDLLRDRMEDPVPVTIAPPDITVSGVTGRRLNLYLYHVTENGSLKNQEIPGHGHPSGYGHPPLSLNLHYLMTAHAAAEDAVDSDLIAQQVLGSAMRVLHDFAIVPPDLHRGDDPLQPLILDPVLAGEFERVKLCLQPIQLDELSKIWTALPQTNFRRSVAYEVAVVQIESRRTLRVAAPVKTRRVLVAQSRRPEITAVYRTPLAGEPSGDPRVKLLQQLTVEGSGFAGTKTWVRLGGLEPIRVAPVSDEVVRLAVPDDQYPIDADHPATRPIPAAQRLQPGAQAVELLVEQPSELVGGGLDRGATGAGPRLTASNRSVFLLVPEIAGVAPPAGTAAGLLTVNGKRLYREGLATYVLVGDTAIEVRQPQPGDPWAPPAETAVQVPLAGLPLALPPPPPGGQIYQVRVLVNGAQSLEEGITFQWMP